MTGTDLKEQLRHYLQVGRDALLWKLDGLGEYDLRRPLTPTGTNLDAAWWHEYRTRLQHLAEAANKR